VVPLARLNRARNTGVEDLITVCPNCHRVLHQLGGGGGDWKRLQRLYRKHRLGGC
jgi:predicted HNH restriction endonuclease